MESGLSTMAQKSLGSCTEGGFFTELIRQKAEEDGNKKGYEDVLGLFREQREAIARGGDLSNIRKKYEEKKRE